MPNTHGTNLYLSQHDRHHHNFAHRYMNCKLQPTVIDSAWHALDKSTQYLLFSLRQQPPLYVPFVPAPQVSSFVHWSGQLFALTLPKFNDDKVVRMARDVVEVVDKDGKDSAWTSTPPPVRRRRREAVAAKSLIIVVLKMFIISSSNCYLLLSCCFKSGSNPVCTHVPYAVRYARQIRDSNPNHWRKGSSVKSSARDPIFSSVQASGRGGFSNNCI